MTSNQDSNEIGQELDAPAGPRDISASGARIVVIEDERAMRRALEATLRAAGYRVLAESDGSRGLDLILREKPSLVLLDIMLPKLDGFALCAELRRLAQSVPVLMVTAKDQVPDRVRGLDIGADDYLVKPFSSEELLARVRALLRRVEQNLRQSECLQLGEVIVDFKQRKAWHGSDPIHLTTKEFAMLELLAEAHGEAVSRERFLDTVWGYTAFPTTRTVDTHITSLRSKIEPDPRNPRWIRTVQGVGYRLEGVRGREE